MTTTLEIEIEVDYDFDIGEPRINYFPDGSGQPGTPPSAQLLSVKVGNIDILEALTPEQIEELAEEALEDALNEREDRDL